VSLALERFASSDWPSHKAFIMSARLLMLLEEGSSCTVPDKVESL
jgi:hypothetical protein